MSLVYTTALLVAETPIAVEQGTVRVGEIGHDLRIVGEPDDLTRLASALLEAAGVQPRNAPTGPQTVDVCGGAHSWRVALWPDPAGDFCAYCGITRGAYNKAAS